MLVNIFGFLIEYFRDLGNKGNHRKAGCMYIYSTSKNHTPYKAYGCVEYLSREILYIE